MCGNCLHGNRDIQVSSVADGSADRSGESTRHKPDMHDVGKSNDGIVPQKLPNKDRRFAEAMEGRPSTARNSLHLATPLTKIWTGVSSALQRVREVQASTPPPGVRAVCGNAACTDLCRGARRNRCPYRTRLSRIAWLKTDKYSACSQPVDWLVGSFNSGSCPEKEIIRAPEF